MTRRDAVRVVVGAAGVIWGQPVAGQQQQQQRSGSGLRLVLDGQDFIEVVYKGQRRAIAPQEIMDALRTGENVK